MLLERKWRAENEEALGEGHALEFDADRAAHGAPGAVGADQVIAAVLAIDGYATRILPHGRDRSVEQQFYALEPVAHQSGVLELLVLHPIGMARLVLQQREIELG